MARMMEEGSCCVCSESTAEGENVIVYCDGPGCNLGTHKACYGITEIPKDDWYCQKCEYESKGHKVMCSLCPLRDGAFKMTNKGKWCHVICALYIPEATFMDTRRMEAINLDLIPPDRFQRICYVCEDKGREEKRYGACIPCSYTQCKFSFHVTCGHIEGLLVENVSRNSKIDYQGYCKMHIKSVYRNQGIKPIARYKLKRSRHASQSSSTTSASGDSPDKEGPPLLKPEIPVPGVSLLPPTLCAESKPPPIKKARKCSSSSSSANGRGSHSYKKSHSGANGNSGFLHGILTSSQGVAAARSASALLTTSSMTDSRPQSSRNLQAPQLPSPVDALELLGIGQPTPVSQHGLQTMEQLLEWQWNEGGQMLMQTAERGLAGDPADTADIVSLLSCLHELKAQNERLQRQVLELENKKGHLSHVTARLADTLNKFGGSSSASSSAPPVLHNATTSSASQQPTPPIAASKMSTQASTQIQMQAQMAAGQMQMQNQLAGQLQGQLPASLQVQHPGPSSRSNVQAQHAPELHPSTISTANNRC